MESEAIAALREEYEAAGLTEAEAGHDPVPLFGRWFDEAVASGIHDPNAMALATATPAGRPSLRIVLLKGFDADGAVFYTNRESRKGDELEINPHAALTLLWHPLQRQVRIEGAVTRVSEAVSDAYFASRPRGSQLGAVASNQSRVVADRVALERAYDAAEATYPDAVARPPWWGGYRVALDAIEFWQGRSGRMHDRIRFRRDGDSWVRERLAP
ncbi:MULTISPECIES: pyridoxamine 5'-phosphate oxidase [Mumia]|uniref:pyridoxamine 5'-phosphate oxidase n=1 Tax=Mumia TaxID=1546255 RepID=UPI001424949B|nr:MULTISPECIES: pyridoxamine 5'-phosphate oxidase [unclassified Mumia]QMW68275.1 pyridoxamine 5'-phosphate oxidase [Mumia sp. ZJ1417]